MKADWFLGSLGQDLESSPVRGDEVTNLGFVFPGPSGPWSASNRNGRRSSGEARARAPLFPTASSRKDAAAEAHSISLISHFSSLIFHPTRAEATTTERVSLRRRQTTREGE